MTDTEASAVGATPRRKSEQRRRSALVSVRFLPFELEIVQALARAAGMEYSVSGYLRNLALDAARKPTGPAGAEAAAAVVPARAVKER